VRSRVPEKAIFKSDAFPPDRLRKQREHGAKHVAMALRRTVVDIDRPRNVPWPHLFAKSYRITRTLPRRALTICDIGIPASLPAVPACFSSKSKRFASLEKGMTQIGDVPNGFWCWTVIFFAVCCARSSQFTFYLFYVVLFFRSGRIRFARTSILAVIQNHFDHDRIRKQWRIGVRYALHRIIAPLTPFDNRGEYWKVYVAVYMSIQNCL